MAWSTNLKYKTARHKWDYGVSTIKRYGSRYKLTQHRKAVRAGGIEDTGGRAPPGGAKKREEGRCAASISRTRATVYELAACNPWAYFCTWTLSDDKGFDRYDLGPWYKDFSQWIRNQRRLTGAKLAYLVVPECHKDGAWHLHALMDGVPMDRLLKLTLKDYLPYRLLDILKRGEELYSWPAYQEKYGWCTLSPVRDRDRCASYIAKYVTKAFSAPEGGAGGDKKGPTAVASLRAGAKLYYASQGLQRAERVWKGTLPYRPDMEWDYENDYVGIVWGEHPGEWLSAAQMVEVYGYDGLQKLHEPGDGKDTLQG